MKFSQFLQKVRDLPVIDTRILSIGLTDSSSMKVQVSRWVKSGKLIQLKRGLYLLAEPYRKTHPSEFYVAAILKSPSYMSLEKVLEYYGLIPEAVATYTSVTTRRPESIHTPVGTFDYRHIKPSLFWGYTSLAFNGQTVFIATPEKALLDFFYLNPQLVSLEYLNELRLQHVEDIKLSRLSEYARRFAKPGLRRAVKLLAQYIKHHKKGVKKL